MRIYWRLKDVPELSVLEPKQRATAHRACYTRIWRKWQFWVGMAACGLSLLGGIALAQLVGRWLQLDPASLWLGMIGAGIGGGIGGLVYGVIATNALRPDYAEYVKQHFPNHSG